MERVSQIKTHLDLNSCSSDSDNVSVIIDWEAEISMDEAVGPSPSYKRKVEFFLVNLQDLIILSAHKNSYVTIIVQKKMVVNAEETKDLFYQTTSAQMDQLSNIVMRIKNSRKAITKKMRSIISHTFCQI